MKSIRHVVSLALLGAALGLLCGCVGSRGIHVSAIQEGKPFDVPSPRNAGIEALSLALLESSSYENDASVANQENWSEYAAQDHVAITFNPPRAVRVLGRLLAVTGLMIPISKDRAPPYIFVRSNGGIRAFCKFAYKEFMSLQAELRNERPQD